MKLKVKQTVLRTIFRFSIGISYRFLDVVHLLMFLYHIQTFINLKFKEFF